MVAFEGGKKRGEAASEACCLLVRTIRGFGVKMVEEGEKEGGGVHVVGRKSRGRKVTV